jgi:hypothetical protein
VPSVHLVALTSILQCAFKGHAAGTRNSRVRALPPDIYFIQPAIRGIMKVEKSMRSRQCDSLARGLPPEV